MSDAVPEVVELNFSRGDAALQVLMSVCLSRELADNLSEHPTSEQCSLDVLSNLETLFS